MDPSFESTFKSAQDEYHRRNSHLAPYMPELIAMRHGLKASILLALPDATSVQHARPALEELCAQTGFHLAARPVFDGYRVLISVEEVPGYELEAEPSATAGRGILSELTAAFRHRSMRPLREYAQRRLTDSGVDPQGHGALFSYPRCCVGLHAESSFANTFVDDLRELLAGRQTVCYQMNHFLRTSPFHLYKHVPCSLGCPATLDYCRALMAHIEQDDPVLARRIERYNRVATLFTDICGTAILFEGEPAADGSYGRPFFQDHPRKLVHLSERNTDVDCGLFDQLYELLRQGDRLQLERRRLVVERRGRIVGAIDRPAHLAWQLVAFR